MKNPTYFIVAAPGVSCYNEIGYVFDCSSSELLNCRCWVMLSCKCIPLGTCYRHLGYPPKFYRVQDAISGNNSRFWYHFRVILIKNSQNTCFEAEMTFKKKGPCQEACKQSAGVGMHSRWSLFQNLGTGKFKTCFARNPSNFKKSLTRPVPN